MTRVGMCEHSNQSRCLLLGSCEAGTALDVTHVGVGIPFLSLAYLTRERSFLPSAGNGAAWNRLGTLFQMRVNDNALLL